jgi:hypothetical protein
MDKADSPKILGPVIGRKHLDDTIAETSQLGSGNLKQKNQTTALRLRNAVV